MTKNCNTRNYNVDHSVYSGEIEIEDFSTTLPSKNRIKNQVEAINLNTKLITEENIRKENEKVKNMTLEQLREMKLISNTNGLPVEGLTDEKWQKEFQIRKLFVTPYKKEHRKMPGRFTTESPIRDIDDIENYPYDGTTNWQDYCRYMNSVLESIRMGQIDYCYYIYQILDLLKFHYNTLNTRYCDGYWEVWLE